MSKKIVIIGGGVAGLSAGIYARLNGFDAEIIEMHSITGGQCTAWDRKGFRFDYCLHWLVGTRKGPFNDIWKETGAIDESVNIIDHEIHTRLYSSDGKEFILYTSLDRWEKYLCNMAPEDKKNIRKMCGDMRKSSFLQPYSDPPGLRSLSHSIISSFKMMPVMILFTKYGKMSCDEYFAKLNFKNKDLSFFFKSMFGTRDFSALAFIMMFAWFNQKNAGYLEGGSLPLAQRMTRKFTDLGGKLTNRKRAAKIITESGVAKGVVLSDGSEIRTDYVISAADGHSTIFDMLEGKYVDDKIRGYYDELPIFQPLIYIGLGINRKFDDVPQTISGLLLELKTPEVIAGVEHKWLPVRIHSFDPSLAPEGKTLVTVMLESNYEYWSKLHEDMGRYREEKARIADLVIGLLDGRFPGLKSQVEMVDVATPMTYKRYTGNWQGSFEGWQITPEIVTLSMSKTLPGLDNFYMAGQWVQPGGGIPSGAMTGRYVIQMMCKRDGRKFIAVKPK